MQKKHSHLFLTIKERNFKNFSYARYATGSRFYEVNISNGLKFVEAKEHFLGNHSAYGYKSEISVLLNGFWVFSLHMRQQEQQTFLCFENVQVGIAKPSQKFR